jgi:hypothetical protein
MAGPNGAEVCGPSSNCWMGRMGEPDQIGTAALLLASDLAS